MPKVTYHVSITHQGPPACENTVLSTSDPDDAVRRFAQEACSRHSAAELVHLTVSFGDDPHRHAAYSAVSKAPLVSTILRNASRIIFDQPPRGIIEAAATGDAISSSHAIRVLRPTYYDDRTRSNPECGPTPGTRKLEPIPRVEESIPAHLRGGTNDPTAPTQSDIEDIIADNPWIEEHPHHLQLLRSGDIDAFMRESDALLESLRSLRNRFDPPTQVPDPDTDAKAHIQEHAADAREGIDAIIRSLHGELPEGHELHFELSTTFDDGSGPVSRRSLLHADGPRVQVSSLPTSGMDALWDHALGSWLDDHPGLSDLLDRIPGGMASVLDIMHGSDPRVEESIPPCPCPFCGPDVEHRIVLHNEHCIAIEDRYPVSQGHHLVIPRRHVDDPFLMQTREWVAAVDLALQVRDRLLAQDPSIDGFNLGFNAGRSAGQSIPHAHVHVIPRRTGDTPEPCGGVRGVIPERMAPR